MNKSKFISIVLLCLISSSLFAGEPKDNNHRVVSGILESDLSVNQGKSRKMQFKEIGRLYAWDIKSVTYLGDKNGAYIMQIKGVGTRDFSGTLDGIVKAGYYTKKMEERLTSSYIFPAVKKGESFTLEISFFLPAGLTPATIGGLLFQNDVDYTKETGSRNAASAVKK